MIQSKDKIARLEAVLAGAMPDRTPVALWRHWPEADQNGDSLARATVAFQRRYDFDFVKLSPASNYAVAGWGGRSEWRGSPVGTRDWVERAVTEPEDWLRLKPLDPRAGLQGELLAALRLVRADLGNAVPIIPTVFNPLAMAKYLAGEAVLNRHLREAPDAVMTGLRTLTESILRFLEAARQVGIDGIFFAVQHASQPVLSEADYRRVGEQSDRQVLSMVSGCWLNILHLHGQFPHFALGASYPVQAINWHVGECPPTLREAVDLTSQALCGGLDSSRLLEEPSPEAVQMMVRRAQTEADPARLILSAGCVLPWQLPDRIIAAIRAAVEPPP
jgi:uroporphyrinogen decarboxylase